MSWDVLFQSLPDGINSLKEIPVDFSPSPLCSREFYERMVFELFPNIDENNDRAWMILEQDGYSIEFDAGSDDPMESLMLHVRGSEKAIDPIKQICDYTGWKAIDTTLGDFIDFDNNPDQGFAKWREFRNKVFLEMIEDERKRKKWWQFLSIKPRK